MTPILYINSIFKYTGHTADLACEMLSKVSTFLKKRRSDSSARPEQPFSPSFTPGHMHERWLGPWDASTLQSCKKLNILTENFPENFKETTVLEIDMFNTT